VRGLGRQVSPNRSHRHRVSPEQARAALAAAPLCSTVIHHLLDLLAEARRLNKTLLAVLYMRESTHEQRRSGNLRNREIFLRKKLGGMGVTCTHQSFSDVRSGKCLIERRGFVAAIEYAQQLQLRHPDYLVFIVTDTRNRFIRGPWYNGQHGTDRPTHAQLDALPKLADGMILATLLHPDAPDDEVRAFETNIPKTLGPSISGKKVGRPKKLAAQAGAKKMSRVEQMPKALSLYGQDVSNRAIARMLGRADSTIRGWLKSTRLRAEGG
jgi:hypothetical protein